jgi:hypothetical protein
MKTVENERIRAIGEGIGPKLDVSEADEPKTPLICHRRITTIGED